MPLAHLRASVLPIIAVFLLCGTPTGRFEFRDGERAQNAECTSEERREALRTLQQQVLQIVPRELASLENALRPGGALAGWLMTHGHVVMAHTGAVPVANHGNAYSKDLPRPQMLQYAPSTTSDPRQWLDFNKESGPYRVIGWAYLAPFDPHGPPKRLCVEASEWFVHDAGWHLMDGGMLATPDAVTEPSRPSLPVGIYRWHPKQWDLHFWIQDDGVPTISFANPKAPGGGFHLRDWVSYYLVNGRKQLPPKPVSRKSSIRE
jgi:hypothetical protein